MMFCLQLTASTDPYPVPYSFQIKFNWSAVIKVNQPYPLTNRKLNEMYVYVWRGVGKKDIRLIPNVIFIRISVTGLLLTFYEYELSGFPSRKYNAANTET